MSKTSKKEDFLSKIPESNTDWVAMQILTDFSEAEFKKLQSSFEKLDKVLFKGWAKEMTFSELYNAIKIAEKMQ